MIRLLAAIAVAAFSLQVLCAEDPTPDPHAGIKALVGKINEKLKSGPKTEAELAPELKEFDELLAGFKEGQEESAAQVLLMKGLLYDNVLNQPEKSIPLFEELKAKYPQTDPGKAADQFIAAAKSKTDALKIQGQLVEGAPFPNFTATDTAGDSVSTEALKGKVVLVDFWATWCMPCVVEVPRIKTAYEKYHDQGFEIIGISLDKSPEPLADFVAKNKIPWPQVFEGARDLAGQYGVQAIPATYLIGADGKILAKGLRGEALANELAKIFGGE